MIRYNMFLGFFLPWFSLMGQATFVIDSLPGYTPAGEPIFIAGSFNSWNPGDTEYALTKDEHNKWFLVMPEHPEGNSIDFKFTRGDWTRVEKGISGEEIPNRQFTFGNGDTVHFVISNWADHGGGGGSTAADNVDIMDLQFYMPQLDRERRIWIYTPPGYENGNERYPVLYMHDGQNLFDKYTSYVGEWEVDETLNRLSTEGYQVPIVIGIDHGESERINEYLPWVNQQYGGGQGADYMDFIIYTLKPFVDSNYRTLPGREFTGMMGSSLGGLISHYGVLKFQDVFSKVGIFSPSYWISDSVWAFTNETGRQQSLKIYQLIGSMEGSGAIGDMWDMHQSLTNLGFDENELFSLEVTGGQHNETFWREQFAEAYLWMYASFASKIHEIRQSVEIEISPNPVFTEINLPGDILGKHDTLEIIDMKGESVIQMEIGNNTKVDIKMLTSGTYILLISSDKNTYSSRFVKL